MEVGQDHMHRIMHSGLTSVRMISKKTLTRLHLIHFSRKSIQLSPLELLPKGLQSYILELSFCNLSLLFTPPTTKTALSAWMSFFSTSSDKIVWRYRSSCNTMPRLVDKSVMISSSMVSILEVLSDFNQNEYSNFFLKGPDRWFRIPSRPKKRTHFRLVPERPYSRCLDGFCWFYR